MSDLDKLTTTQREILMRAYKVGGIHRINRLWNRERAVTATSTAPTARAIIHARTSKPSAASFMPMAMPASRSSTRPGH
jgi:hypothetical protein